MKKALIAFCVAAALGPASAHAQSVADYQRLMQSSCSTEIASFCSELAPGDATLLACLYSRNNRLSDACFSAVMVSAERLRTAVVSMADLERVCANDVARLCSSVVTEKRHLIRCLDTARGRVSNQCNAAIDGAFLRP